MEKARKPVRMQSPNSRLPAEAESTKKKSKHLGHYETPADLGIRWQMDMKYAPDVCCTGGDDEVPFQYTMPEEAGRARFIYACKERSGFSTVDFVKRAIHSPGYLPQTIRTDNGSEFSHTKKTERIHLAGIMSIGEKNG